MGVRNLTQEHLQINNKNIIGWLSLLLTICDMDNDSKNKLDAYLRREDKVNRQKEIDKIWRYYYG